MSSPFLRFKHLNTYRYNLLATWPSIPSVRNEQAMFGTKTVPSAAAFYRCWRVWTPMRVPVRLQAPHTDVGDIALKRRLFLTRRLCSHAARLLSTTTPVAHAPAPLVVLRTAIRRYRTYSGAPAYCTWFAWVKPQRHLPGYACTQGGASNSYYLPLGLVAAYKLRGGRMPYARAEHDAPAGRALLWPRT